MAAETFVTALLLITAIISAGILINAVYPVVWNMAGTFSSASHETDTRMRTDFKIVATQATSSYSGTSGLAKIWVKNIGTNSIGRPEIEQSDVFIGRVGNFQRAQFDTLNPYLPIPPPPPLPADKYWIYYLADTNSNNQWDIGETMEIDSMVPGIDTIGIPIYFQLVLPNGVWRSSEFTST